MMKLNGKFLFQLAMLLLSIGLLIVSWNWQLKYFENAVEHRHISSHYPFILSLIARAVWMIRCLKVLSKNVDV